jgi:FlaG/FlaF family flagellin (archaellin)
MSYIIKTNKTMKHQVKANLSVTAKILIVAVHFIIAAGCQSSAKNDAQTLAEKSPDTANTTLQKEPDILDTGQIYFKVHVTKNNQPYSNYEGDYPTATKQDTFFTIQLSASRDLSIYNDNVSIDIYTKQMSLKSFPVVKILNSDEGKATLYMGSPKGNDFQSQEGSVTITKYNDSQFSGKFEGKATNHEGNKMAITGLFLNVKYK